MENVTDSAGEHGTVDVLACLCASFSFCCCCCCGHAPKRHQSPPNLVVRSHAECRCASVLQMTILPVAKKVWSATSNVQEFSAVWSFHPDPLAVHILTPRLIHPLTVLLRPALQSRAPTFGITSSYPHLSGWKYRDTEFYRHAGKRLYLPSPAPLAHSDPRLLQATAVTTRRPSLLTKSVSP